MSPKVTHRATTGLLLLAALLAAAGCDSADSSADSASPSRTGNSAQISGTPSGPADSGPPPTATPSAPATAPTGAPKEQLLKVVISGGFAGRHDEIVVRQDGTYTTKKRDGSTAGGRLDAAALDRLRRHLKAAGFAALPPSPTGRPVADAFMYQYTYDGHVVLVDEMHRPQALRDVSADLPVGYR
ncbi:hypothetical protein ACFWXK_32255 [Streptomyces sp. NPDC059070]|uniref:hypothetical protein n=1 Tax=Streptomyces sp. NPDC059070 TaxID=3346713 RepID=UPI00367D2A5D